MECFPDDVCIMLLHVFQILSNSQNDFNTCYNFFNILRTFKTTVLLAEHLFEADAICMYMNVLFYFN